MSPFVYRVSTSTCQSTLTPEAAAAAVTYSDRLHGSVDNDPAADASGIPVMLTH